MAGRVFVVTGISGTGVGTSLEKYVRYRTQIGRAPAAADAMKVEDRFLPRAVDALDKVLPPSTEGRTWWQALELPRPVQCAIWRDAFADCLPSLNAARERDEHVFLTFHACWYHLRCREYLSIVDFDAVKRIGPDAFITLIDDIYDVGARLSAPGEIFAGKDLKSAFVDRVIKLLTILQWRAFEITITDRLAGHCGCPHFVFAMKHPMETFSSLLEGTMPTAYVSHPITYVRKKWRTGEQVDKETADTIVESVADLTVALRDQFTLFEPTAIDELCFNESQMDVRWPLTASVDDLLWTPIARSQLERWWQLPAPDGEGSGLLLEAVTNEITKQINARDHRLVEQSDALAVYRPFAEGRGATGVEEETGHYDRLLQLGMRTKPAVAYHPLLDERGRVFACVENAIVSVLDDEGVAIDEDVFKEFVANRLPTLEVDLSSLGTGACSTTIGEALQAAGIDVYNPSRPRGALSPQPVVERQRVWRAIGEKAKELDETCYLRQFQDSGSLQVVTDETSGRVFGELFAQEFLGK